MQRIFVPNPGPGHLGTWQFGLHQYSAKRGGEGRIVYFRDGEKMDYNVVPYEILNQVERPVHRIFGGVSSLNAVMSGDIVRFLTVGIFPQHFTRPIR